MSFKPLDRMWERVRIAGEDSDHSFFNHLLYLGEMVTKLVTAGLIAAIADDRDRHRYRQLHRLVRADGLGEWSQVLDDVLTGPTSQHLISHARDEQRELTQRLAKGNWQYDATAILTDCLKLVDPTSEDLPIKIDGRKWFSTFAQLRNKTRGHGTPKAIFVASSLPILKQSIRQIIDNHCMFLRPWAFLHRNLAGNYRVTMWTEDAQYVRSSEIQN